MPPIKLFFIHNINEKQMSVITGKLCQFYGDLTESGSLFTVNILLTVRWNPIALIV